MKRIGNIWEDVICLDNALEAIIEGTLYKRSQREVQKLLYDAEDVNRDPSLWHRIDRKRATPYAERLCEELAEKTWTHKKPRHRTQYCRNRASSNGKWRELYIPSLDDHIIAHMVMRASMRAFTKGMHPHCCGSVPNRGIKHVNRTIKKWFQNDRQCRYFVKLDIRHFFENIDRDLLISALESKIKDGNVLWAFRQIIDSAPISCPIGYYTSPWLANLYLEDLDWYVEQDLYKTRRGKRIKFVRHYLRYVDDILLVGTSKKDLAEAIARIKEYLTENKKLQIKDAWEIKRIGQHDESWKMKEDTYWCDMGGYKFCKDATILRDGIFLETRRLAKKMGKQGTYSEHQAQSLNSRLGWASHCDSVTFIENDINPYVNIKQTRRIIGDVDKKRKQQTG